MYGCDVSMLVLVNFAVKLFYCYPNVIPNTFVNVSYGESTRKEKQSYSNGVLSLSEGIFGKTSVHKNYGELNKVKVMDKL